MSQNNTSLLFYSSGEQKFKMGLSGLESRCQRSSVPSEDSRGESTSFPFHLLEAALHLRSLLPYLQPVRWHLAAHSSVVTSLSDFEPSWERFSSFKDSSDQLVSIWLIQDNLPVSRSLIQSHLRCPFCDIR